MKNEQDYIRDIAEIRSMMERSSKFLMLSGWAGILAGLFALAGVYIAYEYFYFNPDKVVYPIGSDELYSSLMNVIFLAVIILILSVSTAVFFSYRKAKAKGENLWNPTSRRLLVHMLVPFIAGGLIILVLISNGLIGLLAPFTLLFYGLALFNAGNFTSKEVRILGLSEITLGLISSYYVGYGLLFWALGFGVFHIIYGVYVYYRYKG